MTDGGCLSPARVITPADVDTAPKEVSMHITAITTPEAGAPAAQRTPLAVPPREACRLLSIGTTRLYQLLAAGELESYLDGRARRIIMRSIEGYIARRLAAAGATGAALPEPRRKRGRPRKDGVKTGFARAAHSGAADAALPYRAETSFGRHLAGDGGAGDPRLRRHAACSPDWLGQQPGETESS
jgi:excisionase family DNA binding protein